MAKSISKTVKPQEPVKSFNEWAEYIFALIKKLSA